jgi:hypothetical protein
MKNNEPTVTDFNNWRGGCSRFGYKIEFTYAEWHDWWVSTEQFNNRGRGKGNVCMARIDKELPFRVNNVELKETQLKNRDNNKYKAKKK